MALEPAPIWRAERFYDGDKPPDSRSPFQRDRDRILYSTAFRRLGGVTQVVLAGEGHLFHNRLTHSIKVAQVARRIAERLLAEPLDREHLDPDVVEAAALAHDLGHPPFGHVAEKELDRCLIAAGLRDGFEGNPQSFRILNRLALVLEELDGLNLTRATLSAVLKYPWLRRDGERKWGSYETERDVFEWVRTPTGLDPRERCLEAEIMDWADDITYAVHDVEDFFRSGFIPLGTLRSVDAGSQRERVLARTREKWDSQRFGAINEKELTTAIAATLDLFPLLGPYSGTRSERAAVRNFTATLIGQYVRATTVEGGRLAVVRSARVQVAVLKQLTWEYVIENPGLSTQQHGQRRIISDLFQAYSEAQERREFSIFPPRLQEEIRASAEASDATTGSRLVADAIASMTEDQIIQVHGRLMGTDFGSVTDPTLL